MTLYLKSSGVKLVFEDRMRNLLERLVRHVINVCGDIRSSAICPRNTSNLGVNMSVQFEGSSSSLSDEDEDKDVQMSAKFVADNHNQTQKRRCRLPSGLRRFMHKFLIWKLICLVGFGELVISASKQAC